MSHDILAGIMMADDGGAGIPLSNGSAWDFDCNSSTGWGTTVGGLGAFDPTYKFKLYDTGYDAANSLILSKASAFTPPADFMVLSFQAQFSKLSSYANQPTRNFEARINPLGVTRIYARMYDDYIRVLHDAGGSDLHAHTWDLTSLFWMSFAVTYTAISATADIYIGDETSYQQIATGADVFSTVAATTLGETRISLTDRIDEATRPADFYHNIKVGSGFA